MNHDYCVRLDPAADVAEVRHHINDMLFPEYDWLGKWLPAVCLITSTRRRTKEIFFVHPFVVSICGMPVPATIPIRFRDPADEFLRRIAGIWKRNYVTSTQLPRAVVRAGVRGTKSQMRKAGEK